MWSLIYSKYGSIVNTFLITLLLSLGFLLPTFGLEYSWVRYITMAVTFCMFLFSLILWEYLWKIKWLQKYFCPNLTGKWKGTLEAKYTLPDNDTVQVKTVIVDFNIKMNFLRLNMEGISEDEYMRSEVLSSWLQTEGNNLFLYYTYLVNVKKPKATDEQFFHGSARLELIWDDTGDYYFEGNYWTNRNWYVGGQTSGYIRINKKNN